MKLADLATAATELTNDLKSLANIKLYVCANAYAATENFPDRIIVESIKNLRCTGRFTAADRGCINAKLRTFCTKYSLKLKVIDTDPAMHNAVITCK